MLSMGPPVYLCKRASEELGGVYFRWGSLCDTSRWDCGLTFTYPGCLGSGVPPPGSGRALGWSPAAGWGRGVSCMWAECRLGLWLTPVPQGCFSE